MDTADISRIYDLIKQGVEVEHLKLQSYEALGYEKEASDSYHKIILGERALCLMRLDRLTVVARSKSVD